MTLVIIVLKHQWHAYSLFVSECYHIFIFIIIYLYLSLYIYIDYYIFIWFIIQSVVGVIGIVGNILTILVLSTKVRNRQYYLKYWKWWELFEISAMMRIIWNIGNDENYFLFEWQRGGLFCVLSKVFLQKLSLNSVLNLHILARWKSFVTLLRFLLIFSDERQTTKCWSINFLLIGSLFLFLQCCNMLKLSGALCKCRLKAWQFNFVDIFSSQSVSIYFFLTSFIQLPEVF